MREYQLRKGVVSCLIVALSTLQGMYVLLPLEELWPFSPYPMFSHAQPSTYTLTHQIVGETVSGAQIVLEPSVYFYPFDPVRLIVTIGGMVGASGSFQETDDLRSLFQYLMKQYYLTRKDGYHAGPDIRRLSLYQSRWNWTGIDPAQAIPEVVLVFSIGLEEAEVPEAPGIQWRLP